MLILALDSAGSGCAAAVSKDGCIVASKSEAMERGQDQRLMPLVLDVLQDAKVDFAALDRIAVTTGPGSFTGIRIGLAAATGLGLALSKPVIGIDRFSIYRTALAAQNDLLIIFDSRRKELYCRHETRDGHGEVSMMTFEQITGWLATHSGSFITGDHAAATFPNYLPLNRLEVEICAALAEAADPAPSQHGPRPLYIRPPDVTFSQKTLGA